jgi:hypothetical protein
MIAFGTKTPELDIVAKKKEQTAPEVIEVIRYRDRPAAIFGGISGFAASLPSVAAPIILANQLSGKAFALTTIPVVGVAVGSAPVMFQEQPALNQPLVLLSSQPLFRDPQTQRRLRLAKRIWQEINQF